MQRRMKTVLKFLVLAVLIINLTNCNNRQYRKEINNETSQLSGKIIIFHAGSLTVPFRMLSDSFQKIYPQVKIQLEAAGSAASARKITELGRKCDIMASADYTIINRMLIPDYADWNIKFAGNEMVIGYHEQSRYADQVNENNWYEILLKDNVNYGRSDPNSDPCGYRSILTIKLLEKYYNKPGITEKFLAKDQRFIRPKETDLLALIESNTIDYLFIYSSVAKQHKLPYIKLPDTINLKDFDLSKLYKTVEVNIAGEKPGKFHTLYGEPMVYGITILNDAPNYEVALAFVDFILSERGAEVLEINGQPSLVPSYTETFENIPEKLKKYTLNE